MLALPQPSTRSLQHIYQVQLGRFLNEKDFMQEVKGALFPLVSASIAIYYRMCGSMRPTPSKIHYTFNIRDLSKVPHDCIIQKLLLLGLDTNFLHSACVASIAINPAIGHSCYMHIISISLIYLLFSLSII